MKIVFVNSSLGNQIFQYIFARALELNTNQSCMLDDSFFYYGAVTETNGYNQKFDIDRIFGSKVKLLSEYFTPDVWEYIIDNCKKGISLIQQLKDNDMDFSIVAETNDFKFNGNVMFTPTNAYYPLAYHSIGNIYYHGYWINKWYYWNDRDVLNKELKFPPLKGDHNINYAKDIQSNNSVSVHIRRFLPGGHPNLSVEYYYRAMESISKKVPKATYFVFSDDLNYCKDNYKKLGLNFAKNNIVFVTGNEAGDDNYIDMQLMTLCNHMIIANSSFSYFAALRNEHKNKIVINPTTREI